jgi:hypothetical protein
MATTSDAEAPEAALPRSLVPEPDARMPKPETAAPKPDAGSTNVAAASAPPPVTFDDRMLMTCGSVAFGVAIPLLTGLYGPLGPSDARFWLGAALFIALAFAIWGGNRWLLFKQRQHFDWFNQPARKLMMLVTANVLYTAPVTAAGLLMWFHAAGLPVDGQALQVVVLTNVICVLFVTHAYETLFLIRERESDLTRVERLQRLRAQAELAALKAQVDPHFLFNSLNVLGHLIAHDAPRAREFCDTLAEVYRYVLDSRRHDMVPLDDELAFVRRYDRLLQLRFGAAVRLRFDPALEAVADGAHWRIAPLAIQTLIENAVKHNQAAPEAPLLVALRWQPGAVPSDAGAAREPAIEVENRRRPRSSVLPSSGTGLRNLDERCRLLTGRGLRVRDEDGTFVVNVPIAAAALASNAERASAQVEVPPA